MKSDDDKDTKESREVGASALRQALTVVRDLRSDLESQTIQPLAVVGIGCRVPGADSPEAFWSLLSDKRDAVSSIPPSRWSSSDLYDPDPDADGKVATRWAGVIDALAFDADFFGIGAEEARHMDPQQRIFLEVAYEALEQAGFTIDKLRGSRTGVFAGVVNYNDGYSRRMFDDLLGINSFSGPGVSNSVLAGRLAYLFDLRGPCMAIDTACSSSLVAVHQAAQSLRLKECDQAIVGGVNLILSPEFSVATSRMHLLAPDGRCKPFAEEANGIVRSDGCGVVVLKRLGDAKRDGDEILALIHASAVNQDGRTNGMTAPSGRSQEDLTQLVMARAKLGPDDIGYVEAHGTGTKLGDPIEIAALDRVLMSRSVEQPCWVGSVKANIGHCEAASGIVSLIKVIVCLQRHQIPGQLHLKNLNRQMDFGSKRIAFPMQPVSWPERQGRRQCALVSSFGWSGTNAQLVVGPGPKTLSRPSTGYNTDLVRLTGANEEALRDAVRGLAQRLEGGQVVADTYFVPPAVAAPFRKAFVSDSADGLLPTLRRWLDSGEPAAETGRGLAMIFSGQGNQWLGMVDDLLRDEEVFRSSLLKSDAVVMRVSGWSPLNVMTGQSRADLSRTELAQPCVVAVQLALVELLRSWGVTPTAVTGHSVGEFSAAVCAGALDHEDALTAVIHRGRIMESLRDRGQMFAVLAPEAVTSEILYTCKGATISAINSPMATIVSVEARQVGALTETFAVRGYNLISVNPHYPFHCALLKPLLAELEESFASLDPNEQAIPFVSSSRGTQVQGRTLDARYWLDNAVLPVRFERAIRTLDELGCDSYVEIGPHPTLIQHVKSTFMRRARPPRLMATLRRGRSASQSLRQLKAELFEAGQDIQMEAPRRRRRHQWCHSDYDLPRKPRQGSAVRDQLVGEVSDGTMQIALRTTWGVQSSPLLGDHCMFGTVVVPGAVHLSVVLSHAKGRLGINAPELNNISFLRPLLMTIDDALDVDIELQRRAGGQEPFEFTLKVQRAEKRPQMLSSGSIGRMDGALQNASVDRLREATADADEIGVAEFYDYCSAAGLKLGPRFRRIDRIWLSRDGGRLYLLLQDSSELLQRHGSVIDPGMLDSCFQALFAAYRHQRSVKDFYIPLSIDQLRMARPIEGCLWGVVELTTPKLDRTTELLAGDFTLYDEAGLAVMDMTNVQLKRAPRDALLGTGASPSDHVFQLRWRPVPVPSSTGPRTFAIVSRDPIPGDLAAAIERSGHRTVTERQAYDGSASVTSVLYLPSQRNAGSDSWTAEIAADIEQLRSILDSLDETDGEASLCVLTKDLHSLAPRDGDHGVEHLSGSACAAITRVLAKEYGNIRCQTMDLPSDPALFSASLDTVTRILTGADRHPALRISGAVAEAIDIYRSTSAAREAVSIDVGAQYLVTGGFSEAGQALMRHLIAAGAQHVTLMSRSRPSDELIEEVSQLKDRGLRVQLFQGNVCIAEDIEALMRSARRSGRPLRGIFHLAGVVDDGAFARLDAQTLRRVLEPKVTGTWNLHRATCTSSLDWFVVFSSISTSIGIAGQSAYIAANAFAEALMRHRRRCCLPGTSIGWGPSSTGMTMRLEPNHRERLRELGFDMLSVEQVATLALRVGCSNQSNVLVADVALPTLQDLVQGSTRDDAGQTRKTRTARDGDHFAPTGMDTWEAAGRLMLEEVAAVVRHEGLTLDSTLADLQIDSLTAVAVVQRLRKRTGKTLPIAAFFDSHCLCDVVDKLLKHG